MSLRTALTLASVIATPLSAPPVEPRLTRIAYDDGWTRASSLDWFWMTALGTAVPILGAPVDVFEDSRYTRQPASCGTYSADDTSYSTVTAWNHAVYGEVYVFVYVDNDVVASILVVGAQLEGDALFDVDMCGEPPAPDSSTVTIDSRAIDVDVCGGVISISRRGERSMCSIVRAIMEHDPRPDRAFSAPMLRHVRY
ncbi:MAG TPA: hypothetical protein VGF99_18905 [Myxococcota bacterium]